MALYAISVLLQRVEDDEADVESETTTTSHTLHWCQAESYEDAIAHALKCAKQVKPLLDVVDVLCADIEAGTTKRIAFSIEQGSAEY